MKNKVDGDNGEIAGLFLSIFLIAVIFFIIYCLTIRKYDDNTIRIIELERRVYNLENFKKMRD